MTSLTLFKKEDQLRGHYTLIGGNNFSLKFKHSFFKKNFPLGYPKGVINTNPKEIELCLRICNLTIFCINIQSSMSVSNIIRFHNKSEPPKFRLSRFTLVALSNKAYLISIVYTSHYKHIRILEDSYCRKSQSFLLKPFYKHSPSH